MPRALSCRCSTSLCSALRSILNLINGGLQAFASAWADALTCKGKCKVDANAAAASIGSVLVKAATSAYGGVCVSAPPHLAYEPAHQTSTTSKEVSLQIF